MAANYAEDLRLALLWVRSNKAITDHGDVTHNDRSGYYAVAVRPKTTVDALRDLIKARFGHFVRVV